MKNQKNDFIGFKLINNKLKLTLPKFLENEDSKDMELKVKYMRLLRKYRNYSRNDPKIEKMDGIEDGNKGEFKYSVIEGYILLYEDFIKFGPFIFKKLEDNQNRQGRLNWNKTMNKENLLICNDNFIYQNPFYTNNRIYFNHPMTILYGKYLLEIEETIATRFNINNLYRENIENNFNKIDARNTLDYHKGRMFNDRDRKVHSIMNIINSGYEKLERHKGNIDLNYINNLDNIWEHMLGFVLRNEYYIFKEKFVTGEYLLDIEGKNKKFSGFAMQPDIIKESEGKLYIIDAKNYLPSIHENMPRTADINKQMLYKYFLSKEFDKSNKYSLEDIENIFILPNKVDENIRYLGNHELKFGLKGFGKISVYEIDFDYLVDKYLDDEKIDMLEFKKR